MPPAVEAQSLNHWTAREVPDLGLLCARHCAWYLGDSNEPVTTPWSLDCSVGGKQKTYNYQKVRSSRTTLEQDDGKSSNCFCINLSLLLPPLLDFRSPSTERQVKEREKKEAKFIR